jgi:hypothetical protein
MSRRGFVGIKSRHDQTINERSVYRFQLGKPKENIQTHTQK